MGESRWVTIGGVVVVVAVVVVAAISIRGTVSSSGQSISQLRWQGCSSCGAFLKAEMTERPGVCPKCEKRTAWPAMRCERCKEMVAIDRLRFRSEGREPYCVHCKSGKLVPILDE